MSNPSTTAQTLANSLAGAGVTIVSGSASLIQTADPSGGASAATNKAVGSFSDVSSVLGLGNGVILSTGQAGNISGTAPSYNSQAGTGDSLALLGDPLLDSAFGDGDPNHRFYDSTTLQFSFIPTTSVVTFQYVFASEEYNDYVDNDKNDVFAAFFNGSTENKATFDFKKKPVAVDSINYHASRQLFINNDPWTPPLRTVAYNTEADGFTKVLTCTANVNPGVVNTVKLIISDRGDPVFDSWALLKGGSFTSTAPVTLTATPTNGTSLPSSSNGYTINLTNTGTSAATVTSIQDLLPHGFTYTSGSSTGVTTSNPATTTTSDGDQLLTWTGSYTVPASSTATLHFNVTTSSAYGDYYNDVMGAGSVAVIPTGDTALIKVRHAQEIAVTDPNGVAEVYGAGSYNFGDWLSGSQTTERTFKITNEGATASLTGIAVALAGVNPSDYVLNTTGMSTTLATGQSTTFKVRFKPSTTGSRSATLNITSSDTTKSPFAISLTGWGRTALTGAQMAYVKATNAEANDALQVVAVSGNTIVVGAAGECGGATTVNGNQADNSKFQSGAAYVFERDPSTGQLTQTAYLKASDSSAMSYFGYAVAISGDTIVVGSWGHLSDTGGAYVFVRNPITRAWSQQAYLTASNAASGDEFGYSVAIDGDTIAVGAPAEDSNALGINGNQTNDFSPTSGAAYIFARSGTTWSQQAYLKPNHLADDQLLGTSLSLSGNTLAAGAPGVGTGDVEVYTRSGTTWSSQATLTASNGEVGDYFGFSVGISGDSIVSSSVGESSNAKGVNAALTGGSGTQADNSASYAGAAYVFTRSGTTWSQQAYLKASNTDVGDLFGYAVAISGDVIAIGAPSEASNAIGINAALTGGSGTQADNSLSYPGANYVFVRKGTTWAQYGYLKESNTGNYDQLGNTIALDGNILAVGAPGESSNATGINGDQSNNSATSSGAVYLYNLFSW